MSISVIIPVKNEADYLSELFQVLSHYPQEFSVIFCDGGSIDRSFEMIREYQKNNQDRHIEIIIKKDCMQSILSTFLACSADIKTEYVFLHPVDIDCSAYMQKLNGTGENDYVIFRKVYQPKHCFLKLQAKWLNYSSEKDLSFVWTNGILLKTSIFKNISHLRDYFLEDIILSDYLKQGFKGSCMPYETICSSRRYFSQGLLKRTIVNFIVIFCYRVLGMSTKKLRKIYHWA